MNAWQTIQDSLNLLWRLRHEDDELMKQAADHIEATVLLLAITDPFVAQLYRTYEARWERNYTYA